MHAELLPPPTGHHQQTRCGAWSCGHTRSQRQRGTYWCTAGKAALHSCACGVHAQQRRSWLGGLAHRGLAEADTRRGLPWKAPGGVAPCRAIPASASAASTYVTNAKPRGALVSRSRITCGAAAAARGGTQAQHNTVSVMTATYGAVAPNRYGCSPSKELHTHLLLLCSQPQA